MSDRAAFDGLIDEFYPVWFRFHPDAALETGVGGYESHLPAAGDDEIGALGAWLENLIFSLGELDFGGLDAERQLDFRLMLGSAQLECRGLLARDWRHLDPLRYLPIREIFLLTLHPPRDLAQALARVLEAVPGYLREARAQLAEAPELVAPQLVDAAVQEAEAGIAYLQALAGSLWLKHHCQGDERVCRLCDDAVAAIESYIGSLRREIGPLARGRLGCGEDHLRLVLSKRHFLESSPDAMRRLLDRVHEELLGQIREQAHGLDLPAEPRAILARLDDEPLFREEERLQVYREESNRLYRFIHDRGLYSLPDPSFRILERPLCPLPGPCDSGYLASPDKGQGLLFVSGPDPRRGSGGESRLTIRSHCVQQGWAGAHLLAFSGQSIDGAMPRRLAASAVFGVAWDLHIRRRLVQLGFFDKLEALAQALQTLKAIRLARLDLELHLGESTPTQALETLDELEPDPARATRQLVRLARAPGEAVAGVLGWQILERTCGLQCEDDGTRLGEWHDQILALNPVPPALLVPQRFGEDVWRTVREGLAL